MFCFVAWQLSLLLRTPAEAPLLCDGPGGDPILGCVRKKQYDSVTGTPCLGHENTKMLPENEIPHKINEQAFMTAVGNENF